MLSDSKLERYARQVIVQEVGEEGQERLGQAHVLLVGLGGLGCPAALYLALAGVGRITLMDHDLIESGNLPRQSLFEEADIGRPKAMVAAERLGFLNADCRLDALAQRFDAVPPQDFASDADLWIDASDNYATRCILASVAAQRQRRLLSAAVQGFQGQITTLAPELEHGCFHGLFPAPPSDQSVSRCEQVGIVGAVAGVLGTMLALEAFKELLGIGQGLVDRVLLYDGLYTRVQILQILQKRRDCALCSAEGNGR